MTPSAVTNLNNLLKMKILQRPDNLVFDTENPNIIEYVPNPKGALKPLHTFLEDSDHVFISKHFQKEHPIFRLFGASYFCVYE